VTDPRQQDELARQHPEARAKRIPGVQGRWEATAPRRAQEGMAEQGERDSHEEAGHEDTEHGDRDLARLVEPSGSVDTVAKDIGEAAPCVGREVLGEHGE
jgi:hypothetical protein